VTARRVKVEGDLFHGRVPGGAVYVGRPAPGLPGSPYANPFAVRRYGLDESRRLFREHAAKALFVSNSSQTSIANWSHGVAVVEAVPLDVAAHTDDIRAQMRAARNSLGWSLSTAEAKTDIPHEVQHLGFELIGRDLACWCPLDAAWCHADDLLAVASGATP
jgi:hypothetical protein